MSETSKKTIMSSIPTKTTRNGYNDRPQNEEANKKGLQQKKKKKRQVFPLEWDGHIIRSDKRQRLRSLNWKKKKRLKEIDHNPTQ